MSAYKYKKRIKNIGVLVVFAFTICVIAISIGNNRKETSVERMGENVIDYQNKYLITGINETDTIDFTILGNETISIEKSRFDDIDGMDKVDNRWELEEIDAILNSLRGTWEVDQYVGFVVSGLYYPDLFDLSDTLDTDFREQLRNEYEQKRDNAQNTIPEVVISIRDYDEHYENDNYIRINGFRSPISIILSRDRNFDYYPEFLDQTTVSVDFYVEYPVLYIKVFMGDTIMDEYNYRPATLVISADNKFYLLMNGAFYSLKSVQS